MPTMIMLRLTKPGRPHNVRTRAFPRRGAQRELTNDERGDDVLLVLAAHPVEQRAALAREAEVPTTRIVLIETRQFETAAVDGIEIRDALNCA